MLKNYFKIITIVLLLLCLVAMPVLGVRFSDYDIPGIFEKDAILTNLQFGNGTSVYLKISEDSEVEATSDVLNKIADILKERFLSRGYTDIRTEVVDQTVRADIAQTTYIETLVADVASRGDWGFYGSSMDSKLCDSSMIEDVSVSANVNGGYSITLHFTEQGASAFVTNTASYALKSSYIYLMVDGAYLTAATVPSNIKDSFTFGSMDFSTASSLLSILKFGELPADVVIDHTEDLAPNFPAAVILAIYIVSALLVVAGIAFLILKGKIAGLFSGMSIVASIALLLLVLLNRVFMLNLATLITAMVCILLGIYFQYRTISPIGELLRKGRILDTTTMKKFTSESMKGIWYHAAIFVVTLICWMFTNGTVLSIAMTALVFSVAHLACYFVFTFFGVYTLSEIKRS